MIGDFQWIKEENEANFLYGGERYTITDNDIEKLKNGEILNFFVNEEYGCTLRYEERPQDVLVKKEADNEKIS